MTREDAIQILNEKAYFLYEDTYPYERIAFDMAIKSLSADNDNVNTVSTSEFDKAVEDYLGSEIEIDDLL